MSHGTWGLQEGGSLQPPLSLNFKTTCYKAIVFKGQLEIFKYFLLQKININILNRKHFNK